jgi:flap endonuclease-1
MSIYSFLIAVRSDGQQLMSDTGETTSHLMGMFYRTLRMVDNGIKPLYVFDGAPPKLKSGELAKRFQRKSEAHEQHEEAKETGTAEDIEKFSRRTVRVTKEHNAECQKLLKLMGIPHIIAPTEAEAQCAALARAGKVFAAASEDMDTLTFKTPVLLRKMTYSEQKKEPIQEIHLEKVLDGLGITYEKVLSMNERAPSHMRISHGLLLRDTDALYSSLISAFYSDVTMSIPSRAWARQMLSKWSRNIQT